MPRTEGAPARAFGAPANATKSTHTLTKRLFGGDFVALRRCGKRRVMIARQGCLVLLFASAFACASQTKLPAEVRTAIDQRHHGHLAELRRSYYYGELYDENEKWLLSAYPFADTYHIVDTKGAPIHPKVQLGILPAGTKVVVDKVEFPDMWAMSKRMLTTPRYNTWVYVRGAPDEPHMPKDAKPMVIVLPLDLDTETSVEEAINKELAPDGEVTKWLASMRPTARAAIENKDVVPGMNLQELSASQGDPPRWFVDRANAGTAQVAWYPKQEVWMINNQVTEVKTARVVVEKPEPNPDTAVPPTGAPKPG